MEDLLDRKFNKFKEHKIALFFDIELEENNFMQFNSKEAIKELTEIVQWEKSRKVIKIDRVTFFRGVAVEILALKERINKQKNNTKYIQGECDYTWNFVTEYYLSFFIIITLSRLNGEFSTFIYEEEAKEISRIATSYNNEGTPLNLNNGQYVVRVLSIDYEEDVIELELQFSRDAHATAWTVFERFVKNYRSLSGKRDTIEDNVIAVIETYLHEQANIFSTLRNSLNYKYDKGFHKVDEINIYEKIKWNSEDHELLKAILKLKKTSNIEDSVKDLVIFNRLLLFIVDSLLVEFESQIKMI